MRRMLKFFTFSLAGILALATAQAARAQGFGAGTDPAPRVDVFGGYSFMRSNIVTTGSLFSLNGGSGSVAYNLSNWLGIVGDFGFYEQGNAARLGKSLTLSSYQFGPHISIRAHSRLVPFAQALLGAGHASGTLYTTPLGIGQAPLGANSAFMFTVGGGLDWKLSHTFGIRIVQTEYTYSRFLNGTGNDTRQNNVRLSAGILLSFGRR
jgi:hypothetical protein